MSSSAVFSPSHVSIDELVKRRLNRRPDARSCVRVHPRHQTDDSSYVDYYPTGPELLLYRVPDNWLPPEPDFVERMVKREQTEQWLHTEKIILTASSAVSSGNNPINLSTAQMKPAVSDSSNSAVAPMSSASGSTVVPKGSAVASSSSTSDFVSDQRPASHELDDLGTLGDFESFDTDTSDVFSHGGGGINQQLQPSSDDLSLDDPSTFGHFIPDPDIDAMEALLSLDAQTQSLLSKAVVVPPNTDPSLLCVSTTPSVSIVSPACASI